MEAVTSVLVERAHAEPGLPRMLTASLVLHGVLLAVLVVAPAFRGTRPEDEVRPVMTISLGGAPGPNAGGMNMMGRPIQATAPLAEVRRPAPILPPAARAPEMVGPSRTAAAAHKPAPRPRTTTPDAPATRTVSGAASAASGPAGKPGAAPVDPNRGLGFGGLSTGGGVGGGSYLDVASFCCPDYLVTMLQLIQGNWNARQEVGGEALVKFRIQRDGRITEIELEKSSGYPALDLSAQRALFLTQKMPPLPSAFPDEHLSVHLRFDYTRR
jgi:TonB family protein